MPVAESFLAIAGILLAVACTFASIAIGEINLSSMQYPCTGIMTISKFARPAGCQSARPAQSSHVMTYHVLVSVIQWASLTHVLFSGLWLLWQTELHKFVALKEILGLNKLRTLVQTC